MGSEVGKLFMMYVPLSRLIGADKQDPTLHLGDKIFLEDPKSSKAEPGAKANIPGPIHLVRRGDYLCGLIREYEENRRALLEQNEAIAKMPPREGFGFESHSAVPSTSKARISPSVASTAAKAGKGKRKKTPEYTDSEGSDQ
jgi:chromodomain-helicase-DNA-binding protein 1